MYFSHARTALKFGLITLGFGDGTRVLVPDFVCDALIQPIHDLGVNPTYYPIDDQLQPLWEDLDRLLNAAQFHAIVMVHYFGQPQDILRFQKICKLYKLVLIEDNAHGFGGKLDGRILGTFGDIGIASPRKMLNTRYGGQLYIGGNLQPVPQHIARNSQQFLYWVIKKILSKWPLIRNCMFRVLGRLPDINDISSTKELAIDDRRADWFSSWMLDRASPSNYIDLIAEKRRQKWAAVNDIVLKIGGIPVFSDISEQSSPWAYPFYTKSKVEKEQIKNQLIKAGYTIFPWPVLPDKILTIDVHGNALNRWHRLLCVSL